MRWVWFVRFYDTNRSIGEASLSFSTFSKISLSSYGWDSLGGSNGRASLIDKREMLCDKLHIVSVSHLWGSSRFNHFSAKMWNTQRRLHSNPFAIRMFTWISFRIETNGAISCLVLSSFETRF